MKAINTEPYDGNIYRERDVLLRTATNTEISCCTLNNTDAFGSA